MKLEENNLKEPPSTYYTLKLMIATSMELVFTCYGPKCKWYKAAMRLYNVLICKEVAAMTNAFTPLYCRMVTWAMYDDARSFFAQRLMPQDFNTSEIDWPESLLNDILSDVQYVKPIFCANFPAAWEEKKQQH